MISTKALYWIGGVSGAAVVAAGGVLALHYPQYLPVGLLGSPVVASSPTPQVAIATPAPKPAAPAPTASPEAPPGRPAFDVVRVEPSGDAVVAGHAAAQAHVELRDDGRAIAEVDADPAGQFVIIPPTLGPGPHHLQLAVRGADPAASLSDAVPVEVAPQKVAAAAVTPPAPQRTSPAAAPAPPAPTPVPTPVLAAVQASPPARPLAGPGSGNVFVEAVEASEAGRLQVKGSAEANATVRLYLNGSFVADASAGQDRKWSLTIEHGMAPGLYTMRADEIDRADGHVLARAEVPFAYPLHPSAESPALASATAAAAPSASPSPAASLAPAAAPQSTPTPSPAAAATPVVATTAAPDKPPADVVVSQVQTATVVRGDNLWDLARRYYGDGMRFRQIYEANSSQIKDPSLIYIGQIFVVPKPTPPSN